MTPSTSQHIVIGCMTATLAISVIDNVKQSNSRSPAVRILVGGYVTTTALLIASSFAPELAAATAGAILAGFLVGSKSTTVFDLINKLNTSTTLQAPASPVK